jgi:hypothetical protein
MTDNPVEAPAPNGKWEAAMLAGGDPIARYWAMHLAYNQNAALGIDFDEAVEEMDDHPAQTCRDVVRKFIAMFSYDTSPEACRQEALINEAKRALEREA